MVVLDSVTDVKDWMSDQTPLLHDHLKADQTPLLHDHLKDRSPKDHQQTPLLHDHLKAQQFKFVMNQESVSCFIKNGVPAHSDCLKVGCFSSQWQHFSQQVAIDGGTLLYPDNLKLLENTLKWIKDI